MNWWIKPYSVGLFILMPVLLLCLALPDSVYIDYNQAQKYLNSSAGWTAITALMVFVLASLVGSKTRLHAAPYVIDKKRCDTTINILLGTVVAAYALFLFPIVSNPTLFIDHLHGSAQSQFFLRETLNHMPGVTSLMALQSLIVVLILKRREWFKQPLGRFDLLAISLLVVLCCLRAWLWSERLAIIELALPYAILQFGSDKRRLASIAPIYGILFLVGLFMAGEYFRSWQTIQSANSDSFFTYAGGRLAAYYATAINNGAAFYNFTPTIGYPVYTAHWFHKFPLWSLLDVTTNGADIIGAKTDTSLDTYTTREFNNISGLFIPLLDFGTIVGLAILGILGAYTGRLYARFANNADVNAVLFYPVWFIGITELLRIFYWGNSRFFPVIVATAIIARIISSASNDTPNAQR